MVVSAGVTGPRRPVRFLCVISFRFPFYKIGGRKQWDLKYVILVEDSNTDGPSSIRVRMEYLFTFGEAGEKVSHYYFCCWCYSRK